jgi:hypothetical protein
MKEFVRCRPREGPRGAQGLVDYRDRRFKLKVDGVLLLRICWTKVRDWYDGEKLGIFQRKWAGHCFDILPWERLDGEEGWRDCQMRLWSKLRRLRRRCVRLSSKTNI